MKDFKSLLYVCAVLLIIAGCEKNVLDGEVSQDFFENAKSVDFEPLDQGYHANIAEQNLVIQNEQRFKDFWSSLHSNKNPLPAIPNVDFNTDLVIVSIMGSKPSGGYVVEIARVGVFNDTLGVKVKNKNPDGCITTGAITTPYHIVKINKNNKPVEFFEEEIITDCNE